MMKLGGEEHDIEREILRRRINTFLMVGEDRFENWIFFIRIDIFTIMNMI